MAVQYKDFTSNRKKFKLSDLFGPAKLGKYHNPKDLVLDPNGYEYICASALNNGINKDLPMVNGSDLSLTGANIIAWGKQCPVFAYHKNPCVTSQGMYYYELGDLTEEQALYVIAAMTHACEGKYSYTNCLIGSKSDEVEIYLPATEQDAPDWDYMQNYIAELEKDRIAELENYLTVTGLNDYELTDEDIETLFLSGFRGDEKSDSKAVAGLRKEMREFRVGKLFTLRRVTKMLSKAGLLESGLFPAYSSETANNGIIGFTDTPEFICDKTMPVYITFGDHTRTMNIARQSFSVLDNVKVLVPCVDNDEVLLFMIAEWQKCIPNIGYARHWKLAKDCKILLPICTDAANNPIIDSAKTYHPDGYVPDWDFMSRYIRAIEKIVIKDVVKYKDEMIQKTKEIVGVV